MITVTVLILTFGIEIILGVIRYENEQNKIHNAKKVLY